MDIEKILLGYESQLLDKNTRMKFSQYNSWINDVSEEAGIYVFFNSSDLVYVGQSGLLKGRMRDVRRTVNHTLRRAIGRELFYHEKGFEKATSKNKFPDHIEVMVDEYMQKLDIRILPVPFGRAEIEEYIVDKYSPLFNTKRKRE